MATTSRLGTAEYTPERQLAFDQVEDLLKLQKAAQKISSILELDRLIDQVVNDVAVSFGCVESDIYLYDEERGELVLACAHGCAGCEVCGKGNILKLGKEGMVGYVAGTGQMRYAPDVRKDPYYIGCEESTQSEVAIPLHVEGKLVGVFTASHPDLDAFPAQQLRLLQSLCTYVAVAVHNARRFQEEQHQRQKMSREANEARKIQQALLPRSSPYIPGFVISGLSTPAGAVGGDWYDFIPFNDSRWGLVLADVSGKGMAAALLMSATRGMLRSLAEASCSPSEVLTKLNQLLVNDFPSGRFVTMVYAVLNPETRTADLLERRTPASATDRELASPLPRHRAWLAARHRTRRLLRGANTPAPRRTLVVLQRRYYRSDRSKRRRVRRGSPSKTLRSERRISGKHSPGCAHLRQRRRPAR